MVEINEDDERLVIKNVEILTMTEQEQEQEEDIVLYKEPTEEEKKVLSTLTYLFRNKN
jgi:hypothetical protein